MFTNYRRSASTTRTGGSFDAATIQTVWNKGNVVQGYDPALYRKDSCGMWMERTAYGKTTEFGWEIDHKMPVSLGGSDDITNLQPLQWQNNRHKADNWPQWSCALRAAA